jgi:hypothetical protein
MLIQMSQQMISARIGLVDPSAFQRAIQSVCRGEEIPLVTMLRTIQIEAWLRHLQEWAVSTIQVSAGNEKTQFWQLTPPDIVGCLQSYRTHVQRSYGVRRR